MTRELHSFAQQIVVSATSDGLELHTFATALDWERPESWPVDAVQSALGKRVSYEIATLLEMDLASTRGKAVLIPYENFAEMDRQELALHKSFSQPSPFLLHIDRSGVIGRPDFQYKYRYMLGGQPVPLQRIGPYLCRTSTAELFHMDPNHFALVDAMERFNALPPAARNPQASWMAFADVKRLSGEVNASLDRWLESNDVIVPSSIGVDFYEEQDGSLSFVPTSDSLDAEEFRTVFQRNAEAHGFYTIQRGGSERVRVVLDARQKAVLERMKRVQRVRGSRKDELIRDPLQAFDGIAGDVELPESYSDRVIGIGEFSYAPVPKTPGDETSLSELWGAGSSSFGEGDRDKDQQQTEKEAKEKKKTLLIETNQDEVDSRYLVQSRQARGTEDLWSFRSPDALSESCQLKRHQQLGVEWLQRCSQIPGRTGVLLADDMGVGKTLQLLTFLAWCIESGLYPELSKPRPPYRPILITAPLILLETQSWESEMKRFFVEKGNIFLPVLPLYGPELRAYRRKDLAGTEGDLGKPILDLDRIRQHRVVITNYEALRDYEFSFAYHPDGESLWSVVVSDEAQEFKTPNSRISHAIKKLQPPFRIACTGTPVENRLLDLWNIFDAVQPGLLGSAQEFVQRYESRPAHSGSIEQLKQTILYERPNAFMLRRSKEEVLELPPKHIHRVDCNMSDDEIEKHKRLAEGIGQAGRKSQRLDLLHDFARLYQHPLLVSSSGDEFSTKELTASSSKLRNVLEILRNIERAGEKAIIFARHKHIQRMLARVIADEFGLPVRILNGDTPKLPSSRRSGGAARGHMLNEFRGKPGFNVIVLSPFVAGVGLTIVEANHVIHYGRWWNPAVEAQATDRAYRLGQAKPVHVYLPVLCDKTNQVPRTFDQLLDDLMIRKEGLAKDTLAKEGFRAQKADEESAGMEIAQALSL
jgi:hypothetical protein